MVSVVLEFLAGSGVSSLPEEFTLADLVPYLIQIWVSLGLISAVFGAFSAVFASLLEGVR